MHKNCSLYCAIQKNVVPLQLFSQYLHAGYFPFFQEDHYNLRLQGIIKQTIETDIPVFAEMEIASVPQGKGFIVKDDVERAIGNIIPLWMFGFVY